MDVTGAAVGSTIHKEMSRRGRGPAWLLVALLATAGCERACGTTQGASDAAPADEGLVVPPPRPGEPKGGTPYRVVPADGPGVDVEVPSVGLAAWLPEAPTRHAGGFMKVDGALVDQEELAVAFMAKPGVGCSVGWFPSSSDPTERLLAQVLREHARVLHASVTAERAVPFAPGAARDAVLAMTVEPNRGTARVRLVARRGFVVVAHTFVHHDDRLDPVVARCLESVAVADGAGGRGVGLGPFAVRSGDAGP
ncbi:MAG: hypothetical protein JNL38_28690 [Myxococcales bacterium]|nr:hypothetical protein [Myxococcales bacterium]